MAESDMFILWLLKSTHTVINWYVASEDRRSLPQKFPSIWGTIEFTKTATIDASAHDLQPDRRLARSAQTFAILGSIIRQSHL
jgi:hypothetical protein